MHEKEWRLHCYSHALFCRRSLGNILLVALTVNWRHIGWQLTVAVSIRKFVVTLWQDEQQLLLLERAETRLQAKIR